jgi:hypothetical protein
VFSRRTDGGQPAQVSWQDYSRFIAELLSQPNIQSSTVAVWPDSPYTGIAEGDVMFTNGLRLRHHRIPAPNMSFERPNLPALVREIEDVGKVSGTA